MANDRDKTVRAQIKAILQPAYASAVIYPSNALSRDITDSPALFRTTAGTVHGWLIIRSESSSEFKTPVKTRDVYDYTVLAFYGFRPGGTEASNSDDEFGEILDTAFENLKAKPTLDLDGVVDRHELLQFDKITTINCGEETLHFAQGRLTVHLCC